MMRRKMKKKEEEEDTISAARVEASRVNVVPAVVLVE
jgi:hypothetical protein